MGHSRCFFYFFNFRTYIGILSRISLKKNWSLELSQKASELNFYLLYILFRQLKLQLLGIIPFHRGLCLATLNCCSDITDGKEP